MPQVRQAAVPLLFCPRVQPVEGIIGEGLLREQKDQYVIKLACFQYCVLETLESINISNSFRSDEQKKKNSTKNKRLL